MSPFVVESGDLVVPLWVFVPSSLSSRSSFRRTLGCDGKAGGILPHSQPCSFFSMFLLKPCRSPGGLSTSSPPPQPADRAAKLFRGEVWARGAVCCLPSPLIHSLLCCCLLGLPPSQRDGEEAVANARSIAEPWLWTANLLLASRTAFSTGVWRRCLPPRASELGKQRSASLI